MSYSLIIPSGIKPKPDKYEIRVAEIVSKYFGSDVEFIPRSGRPTPDLVVRSSGVNWEVKNIRGNGKHTIEDNLRKASSQSGNIIISLLRPTKMSPANAASRINFFLTNGKRKIERVLLITKQGKVLEIL